MIGMYLLETSGVDVSQEIMTLALSNVLGSFVQSIPVTGAFTRSAVISASGVRTPMAGLYSGQSLTLTPIYLVF
jgi:sodium-independent sulfate anion transporter 11